ncbi:hypothetical protein [Bradyrhizobium sp. 2TAF24]|uniref:hypothetical protein n=1 Tax=Bradyrhizobium sp. 2TAF24 TaxID=3233011 RepID=UPI003F8E4B68
MTSAALAGEVVLFALGVLAGLSWPRIRAWARGAAASAKEKIREKIKADIERGL